MRSNFLQNSLNLQHDRDALKSGLDMTFRLVFFATVAHAALHQVHQGHTSTDAHRQERPKHRQPIKCAEDHGSARQFHSPP